MEDLEIQPLGSVDGGVDITPEKDGGILKVIKKEGEGDDCPSHNSEVFVHYTGTLLNGEKFDSSHDRGQLFSFTLGQGHVIKAWDIGVATMKKGEVCVLTCRADYAYGDQGSPPKIPAKATLVFEVELHYWKDKNLTGDEGVIMKTLTEGEGYSKPNQDALVTVHIRGTHMGITFEERDVSFTLGEGYESGICPAIEKALYEMKLHQKAKLTIQPRYGLTVKQLEEFGLSSDAVIEYEVYLSSFEKAKEHWEMDLEEKLDTATKVKEKGAKYFKGGDYSNALHQYERMVKILDVWKEEEKAQTRSLKCISHLNAAMCLLKLQEFIKARENCDKALEIEKENVKGLFRRGQANAGLRNYEEAKQDFQAVLQLEPSNKAAKDQLHHVILALKREHEREKKLYGNMFKKLAMQQDEPEKKDNKPDVIKEAYEKAMEEGAMETDERTTEGQGMQTNDDLKTAA